MRGGSRRSIGDVNPRSVSGYTSISLTRETRRILQDLQREAAVASADELIYRLVAAELLEIDLDELDRAQNQRNSIEFHDRSHQGDRKSIERTPLSPATPEAR